MRLSLIGSRAHCPPVFPEYDADRPVPEPKTTTVKDNHLLAFSAPSQGFLIGNIMQA